MPERWIPLRTPADLDRAIDESAAGPVVILKHSQTCGTSAQAFDGLTDWMPGLARAPRAYLVVVQTDREMSNAIAARFGVRHESPQALVLRNGAVRWHGSHHRVTPADIESALAG